MTTFENDEVNSNTTEKEMIPLTPEERTLKSENIIKDHMMISLGFGAIPIPAVDLIGITGSQLNMLKNLSSLYNQEFTKDLGKKSIASLVGGGLSVPIAMGIFSLIKSIPLVGQTAGSISMGASGASLTYAVGKVFVQHFESGGTFLTFDSEKVREYFKSELEKGKNIVEKIKKRPEASA